MRVLYFHQYFTSPKGVGGNRSYWMARALVDAGHSVHMVCANSLNNDTGIDAPFVNGKRNGAIDGIEVTEFELGYTNDLGLVQRSLKFLLFAWHSIVIALRERYDLIFCSSTPLTASLPGITARWLRRKPFVFEVRDLWPELPKAMGVITNPVVLGAMSFLEWVSYRSAHACVGLSPGIVAGIQKRSRTGYPTAMIPNGCDLGLFDNKSQQGVSIDGIDKSDFVAIFIGAHGMANGLDAVLDAAANLRDRKISNIKCLFVGNGKLKPHLTARKEREKLDNCVFLPPMPKDQLSVYLDRADAGLMVLKNVEAFYYGTSPNKFFDYLAAGKPILNNYPGWLADMISELRLGIAVPPDSPEAFANALIKLSEHPAALEQMGERAVELAETQFDRQLLARQFVSFLEAYHPEGRPAVGADTHING